MTMKLLGRPNGPDRRLLLGYFVLAAATCWIGCSQPDEPDDTSSQDTTARSTDPGQAAAGSNQAEQQSAALDVLQAMAQAYKNASTYADNGQLRMQGQEDDQLLDRRKAYLVAMERPNKLRMLVHEGILVSDGRETWAYITTLPNQVLRLGSPRELTIESVFFDHVLTSAMGQGETQLFSWVPLQGILLLADDPLKSLLAGAERAELLEPAAIGQDICHRVELERPDGEAVLWIDQQSHVLRRFEFPTDALAGMIQGGVPANFSLVAEFTDAQLGGPIDPNAFRFEPPPGASPAESFSPPEAARLGKPAPDFTFVGLDGSSITRQSLAGKVVVLDFWATWCEPCRESLPILETVYQKYKNNDQVAFLAVSVDEIEAGPRGPAVADDVLVTMFSDLKVTLPIARDSQQYLARAFDVRGIPTTLLLDAEGNVQDLETGVPADGGAGLGWQLEKLLAGEDAYPEKLERFALRSQQRKQRFEQWLRPRLDEDFFAGALTFDQSPPRAEILPRSDPQSLKIEQLWSCSELESPGNILLVDRQTGPPRMLVIDAGGSVAEIASDGTVGARHPMPVTQEQSVAFLRTATDAAGRRYFVASASGQQQLHLLDENLKPLLAFPQDAPENPHAGIGDVQFGDLDADGTPEICVGYFGVVGIHGVSLDGERIWRNRTLATVLRMAVLETDSKGSRLACTNELGTLVIVDSQGKRQDEIRIPNHAVAWITAADLDGDGRKTDLCALARSADGQLVGLGLNSRGDVLWSYPLPQGMHYYPLELVTSGRLAAGGPEQWVLCGADGSIHILAADGTLIDRFDYGKPLSGIAVTEWDGRTVLLVSTPDSLDAWQVGPKAD